MKVSGYVFALVSVLVLTFSLPVKAEDGGNCNGNCFTTKVVRAEKNANGCTEYEFEISHDGSCRYDLSHYTVEVPYGEIKNLSNSENWKQVFGKDPKTGLTGFKIDDIPNFGKGSKKSFTVSFTLCINKDECAPAPNCWQPKVAYKAGTCIDYQTVTNSCADDEPQLKASLIKTNPTCFTSNDGSLEVVLEEGQEPFTYLWSGGQTTASVQNLSAGDYSVEVTDANGKSVTLSGTLTQPDAISIEESITQPACSGSFTGSIAITVSGGAAPYSYQWNTGATTSSISNIAAGFYSVVVTDANGCQTTKSFNLQNSVKLTLTTTLTLPSCTKADGAIDLTVTGGAEPYTFQWSNGATTEDVQNLATGSYSVTVTDANGCKATTSLFLRENNTLTLSYTVMQTSCLDDGSGAINLNVGGGTAPYTFVWGNGATTEDLSNLTAGQYKVTITDSNGCAITTTITVSRKTIQLNAQIQLPLCAGESTGSIIVTPVNGVAPYTYSWSTGETGNALYDLGPGSYTLTITDATGCSRMVTYTLTSPPPINATASVQNSTCGADGTATIDLSVTGGAQPYTYTWSNGETTQDITGISTGTYTVVITDANGCTKQLDVTVEAASPDWACLITEPTENVLCSTDGNTLTTSVDGATSYQWTVSSSDGSWAITSGENSNTITYTSGGENSTATFTLTIEKDGCTLSCSYTITTCEVSDNPDDPGDGDDNDDGNDDGDDDEDDGDEDDDDCEDDDDGDSGNPESCEECFATQLVVVSETNSCKTYTATITTTGNCRYDLSHWTIAIPCGKVKNYSNSEGWKMEFGKDPTTGVYGLKVDNIDDFGKKSESFTVTFTICDGCNNWEPVAAYKAGQCIAYDSLTIEGATTTFSLQAYPNPFADKLNVNWTADTDEYVVLELVDQSGNAVSRLYEGYVQRGESYEVTLVADQLRDHMYFYRYRSTNRLEYGKLLKY
jgi:hypothetical protein